MPVKDPPADPAVKDPPAAPDLAGFLAEVKTLLGDYRKDINALSKQVKELGGKTPKADPDPNPDLDLNPDPDPKPPKKAPDPAANTELLQLQRQIKDLTAKTTKLEGERESERNQRLETERTASVRTALADIPFRDEAARTLFFNGVINQIKRDGEGNLVADSKDGPVMFDAFIKDQAAQATYLLQPQGSGGAGARAGKPGQSAPNGPPQMEDLTPARLAAMKPEEKAAVFKHVEEVARQALTGAQ
jgi:hypothetical protein